MDGLTSGLWFLYLYILIQKKFNWYAFHTDTRTSIRTENFLKKVTKKTFKKMGVFGPRTSFLEEWSFTASQIFSETDLIVCWRIGIDFIDFA